MNHPYPYINADKAPACNLMPGDTEQLLSKLGRASPFVVTLSWKKVIHVVKNANRD